MNLENALKTVRIACNIADWFSIEQHVDYDFDLSLGILFAEGRIVFYNGNILEFTESITPDRVRYRYHYMNADGDLIFRYDNVPHYPGIPTFPHHKHCPDLKASYETTFEDVLKGIENILENERL